VTHTLSCRNRRRRVEGDPLRTVCDSVDMQCQTELSRHSTDGIASINCDLYQWRALRFRKRFSAFRTTLTGGFWGSELSSISEFIPPTAGAHKEMDNGATSLSPFRQCRFSSKEKGQSQRLDFGKFSLVTSSLLESRLCGIPKSGIFKENVTPI
jgi:hypothetical protein